MEHRKPGLLGLVEVASRHAGVWAGVTAAASKSIGQASAGGAAALGRLLHHRPAPTRGERPQPAGHASAGAATWDNAFATRAAALESDDAAVPREPESPPRGAGAELPALASQCTALQAGKELPVAELGPARSEVEEAVGRENALPSQAAILPSDLAADRRALEEARGEAAETYAQVTAKLGDLHAERDALASDLVSTRSELEEAIAREDLLRMRVGTLESDLAAARCKLEDAQREAENLRSELREATCRLSAVIRTSPTEAEVGSSDAGDGIVAAGPAATEAESSWEATAARSDAGADSAGREQDPRSATLVAEATSAPIVSLEEVRGAAFPDAATRVIFTRAFSGMASQDVAVRAAAAKTLGKLRLELSARVLLAQLAREPSAPVRQECIKGLTALEVSSGRPAVERALGDPDVAVRLAAVRGLYRLAGAASAPALARMLSDKDEEVRRRAATCIGWLGREEHAVALLPLLTDQSVSVRHAAVEALANLRSRRVVVGLIDRLSDREEFIQKAALSALETITGKRMSEAFPTDEESRARLIARWRAWWKHEALGTQPASSPRGR